MSATDFEGLLRQLVEAARSGRPKDNEILAELEALRAERNRLGGRSEP